MFAQKVIDELQSYVYALVDPRNDCIFYIGKGKGNRVFQHAEDALDESDDSLKLETIRAIHKEGLEVKHYIIRYKLTDEAAFLVESVLIDMLSYDKFNKENMLTNIASGHHQWDEGIKTTEELNLLYDCKKIERPKGEKIEPQEGDLLLLVSLNKSYDRTKSKGIYKRENDYESTRKYWFIDTKKIPRIAYVLGVYKGIVRTVLKPSDWVLTDQADDGTPFKKPRVIFEGSMVTDSPYLNKDVSEYPFGSGGAITYMPYRKNPDICG